MLRQAVLELANDRHAQLRELQPAKLWDDVQLEMLAVMVDRGALELVLLGGLEPQPSRFRYGNAATRRRVHAAVDLDRGLSSPGLGFLLRRERFDVALAVRI